MTLGEASLSERAGDTGKRKSMSSTATLLPNFECRPVTPERWADLERLFGERGADGGCWCMWWRLTRSQFYQQVGDKNKQALKAIVDSGQVPGLMAYVNDEPIAWCSIGPRETYPSLERSRTLKRIDDKPVWSVVCFFVDKRFRGQGLMVPFLRTAVDYAREHGAKIVEGYPVEPGKTLSGASGFTGVASAFRKAGFVEALRRAEHRPIMRYVIEE
jgi:GNAT superfamily N-acetyltransferase